MWIISADMQEIKEQLRENTEELYQADETCTQLTLFVKTM